VSAFDATQYGASGIADEYDDLYADEWDTDAAVDTIADLADGRPILEFGIGTGRLALPLVERGLVVHGVDGSEEMVDRLRAKPRGPEIPVTIGDFADVAVGARFGLVVLAVNTIFALPDQRAQVRCFANAARHLAPGGAFVIEAWIPDVGAFRRNRLVRQRVVRDGLMTIESLELDPVDQMMRTTQAVLRNGSVRLFPANHRYAWPAELDLMAQLVDLVREQRWADWRRRPFDGESQAHVTVYRKSNDNKEYT
jgi:SAM-dependent methyltransferase